MVGKMLNVLYLDSDYFLTLSDPALAGIQMEVYVEVPPDVTTHRQARLLQDGITVHTDRPLNWANRMSTYEPSAELLTAIKTETASGKYDWVLIGNCLGAGLIKGKFVAPEMRDRTIIMANSHPKEGPYRALGYRHFASRDMVGRLLVQLINSQGEDTHE